MVVNSSVVGGLPTPLSTFLPFSTCVICSLASSACSAGCTPSFSAEGSAGISGNGSGLSASVPRWVSALRSADALSLVGGEELFLPMWARTYTQRPLLVGRDYRDTGMHRTYDLALRVGVDPVREFGQLFINAPPEGDAVCNRGRSRNRAEAGNLLVSDYRRCDGSRPSCIAARRRSGESGRA